MTAMMRCWQILRSMPSTPCAKKEDKTGEEHVIQGADEYQLMVEHFSDAVLGRTGLDHTPDESIANMHVLDGLSAAAKTGNTVNL